MNDKELRMALDDGRLQRIAMGWFATPLASSNVVGAIRAGGRVGCLTGCALHGVWTPHQRRDHLILPKGKARVRGVEAHRAATLPRTAVYPLADCLEQVARHHDPESALMVLESAVNGGKLPVSDARAIIAGMPEHKRRSLDFFDPRAMSGSETRVRLFLQQHRFPVRPQVFVPGSGYVDLLVGRSLIIECDSVAHHSDPTLDRDRDLNNRLLGYDSLRLSYPQIHQSWPQTSAMLLSVLRTRHHLKPPARD